MSELIKTLQEYAKGGDGMDKVVRVAQFNTSAPYKDISWVNNGISELLIITDGPNTTP